MAGTSDHEVLCASPAEGRILLMAVLHFVAQNLSLSPALALSMTKIMLKESKMPTHYHLQFLSHMHYHWRLSHTSSGLFVMSTLVSTFTLSCCTRIYPALANSIDPDQLASEEAN